MKEVNGLEPFINFVLERVREDKHEEAQALAKSTLEDYAAGKLNAFQVAIVASKVVDIVKPEFAKEVKDEMKKFAKQLT
jgi:hypothetical protein